ncbi:hypothetical protein RJ640_015717 [Escallonia rubra]|uniref:Uncharacterized protein n=1 Tax=Escallonia rubra TaxID=112253 RepID=A0AA88UU26_9ASTE|nr:hypothetical protein RJ640_015717 [Escallonia rubra]
MKLTDNEAMLQGQAEIWQYMISIADSMALKCAVELQIVDIIHSHGCPLTLSQIVSSVNAPSPDISCLARIMRLLVRKKIFTASPQSHGRETLYDLTRSSRWLLRDTDSSLAPMVLMHNHPSLLASWHHLSGCVREGGIGFGKIHGCGIWDFASANPDFNKLFNDCMACSAKIAIKEVISAYKDGFDCIGSLVDVGGGTGTALAEIVRACPHIKGVNFDLPHVIATAPKYDGVFHVCGDMFKSIPRADAVLLKWIMHDWNVEDCVRILKNCLQALPEKVGKVIILDLVLQPDDNGLFENTGLIFDLIMMVTVGGKERTETEWKKLLNKGGFPHYMIVTIPAVLSIIEAYPA